MKETIYLTFADLNETAQKYIAQRALNKVLLENPNENKPKEATKRELYNYEYKFVI